MSTNGQTDRRTNQRQDDNNDQRKPKCRPGHCLALVMTFLQTELAPQLQSPRLFLLPSFVPFSPKRRPKKAKKTGQNTDGTGSFLPLVRLSVTTAAAWGAAWSLRRCVSMSVWKMRAVPAITPPLNDALHCVANNKPPSYVAVRATRGSVSEMATPWPAQRACVVAGACAVFLWCARKRVPCARLGMATTIGGWCPRGRVVGTS